jgi:RND family efflux transporter MFP subunit
VDEKNGDYAAKKAFVMAAQANVDRLLALESFKRITAPFDGVITSRHTDIGALINAGHQSGKELFTISDVHKLRLYVTLPQNYAARIKPDMVVQVDVPEYPGKHFSAKLLGTSESVNESSGAMLMQFEVDNSSHELLPGEYGSVTFIFPANEKSLQIPASAILYKKEGPFIAVVAGNKRVMFKRVEILKDLGTSLDIAAILNASEMVINNPPESLMEGDLVKLKMSHSAEKKTTAPSIIPNTASKTKSQS